LSGVNDLIFLVLSGVNDLIVLVLSGVNDLIVLVLSAQYSTFHNVSKYYSETRNVDFEKNVCKVAN